MSDDQMHFHNLEESGSEWRKERPDIDKIVEDLVKDFMDKKIGIEEFSSLSEISLRDMKREVNAGRLKYGTFSLYRTVYDTIITAYIR